ncbi:MAG: ATPase domain-containing protein [Candidatus Bathyarchaeia archaeon]
MLEGSERMVLNPHNRVPTGISGLDEVIGGGFPRGSMIVLAGNPGTGKTIFSALFLYNGIVNYGERGIYVSFAESRETFLSNTYNMGLDFEKLEKEGKFRIIDMLTVKGEAAPSILETLLEEASRIGAKRIIIDSFSAMAQAFRETHEARIVLHTILSRVTRLLGCTVILVVEVPYGENKIGLGIEEFVADGIILLNKTKFNRRILRKLEVLKMRGVPIPEAEVVFTLKGGFKVFPPFKPKPVEKPRRFQPQPDTEEYFSTGSPDLDEMLGGGYPRGSLVLLEVGEYVSIPQFHLIIAPTDQNFLAHGRAILSIPSRGVDHNLIRKWLEEAGFTRDEINKRLRICVKENPELKPEPYLVTFRGESLAEDYAKYLEVEQKLIEDTDQPILHITGVDTLIDMYGARESLSVIRTYATRVRETGGLGMLILKPGYSRLAKIFAATADVHLRITRRYGSVLLYGVKPRTNLYVLEMDMSKGYIMPKLTSII